MRPRFVNLAMNTSRSEVNGTLTDRHRSSRALEEAREVHVADASTPTPLGLVVIHTAEALRPLIARRRPLYCATNMSTLVHRSRSNVAPRSWRNRCRYRRIDVAARVDGDTAGLVAEFPPIRRAQSTAPLGEYFASATSVSPALTSEVVPIVIVLLNVRRRTCYRTASVATAVAESLPAAPMRLPHVDDPVGA
jgi:hypothetical protein